MVLETNHPNFRTRFKKNGPEWNIQSRIFVSVFTIKPFDVYLHKTLSIVHTTSRQTNEK